MPRNSVSQPQRTQNNPLNLGTFNQTALRYLKGSLGPEWKVVGRADTNQTSNGGIGGGTFNHWFAVTLEKPGWIILTKGPPRPKYIQVSVYDLNTKPIQGRSVFDADSIHLSVNGEVYIPYLNTVMQSQSVLYNTFNRLRLDRGDDRYFPLEQGSYLICVSSTRNEPINYELGVVIEFPVEQAFFELEDFDGSVCLQETDFGVVEVLSPIIADLSITLNAFTNQIAEIAPGITVTVADEVSWYIGERIHPSTYINYKIILEPGNDIYYSTVHDHSLSEWRSAWEAEHQETDKFPALFADLTDRP